MKKEFLILVVLSGIISILFGVYMLSNDKKITISFNPQYDISLSDIEVEIGESVELPILEREGYVFLGHNPTGAHSFVSSFMGNLAISL